MTLRDDDPAPVDHDVTMTIDELISQLELVKRMFGGNTKVWVKSEIDDERMIPIVETIVDQGETHVDLF